MTDYRLVHDYKEIEVYRESFNELAKGIFEIDFKKWYEKGCWNDSYRCYSYVEGEIVIANASTSEMTIISEGTEYKALQVGTVMTHPAYRNQGLSGKLMDHIITQYEKDYDFIYLFANDTVLDFYPKFGFERMQQYSRSLSVTHLQNGQKNKTAIRKINTENQCSVDFLKRFADDRRPVSSALGVKNNEDLLMFYFLIPFNDSIYYLEEEDIIVLFEEEEGQLHLFDVISKKQVDMETVLQRIISENTKEIIFHFIPDYENGNIKVNAITESDDVLFIRPSVKFETKYPLFPLTSHA